MPSTISKYPVYTDYNFLQSLRKLTRIKFPSEVKNASEALFYLSNSLGVLNLPLEDENLIVVYESLNPLISFINASVRGNPDAALFNVLDSKSTNPDVMMLLVETNYSPPNNLFMYTPSTILKKYVVQDNDATVISMVTSSTTMNKLRAGGDTFEFPECRQLISLKSFLVSV